jgi:hypothetical protein
MNIDSLLEVFLVLVWAIPILVSTVALMLRRGWLPAPFAQETISAGQLDQRLAAAMGEIETDRLLRNEWETRLLPEPKPGEIAYPDYPMSSPYKGRSLSVCVDDGWLPVSRSRPARAVA